MEKIDEILLDTLKKDKNNKNINAKENHKAMLQFFYCQNNIFKYVSTQFKVHEIAIWIKSIVFYIKNKNLRNTTNYTNKSILFVDLGHNIGNELSYEHICIVLKSTYDKLFVIPCSFSRIKNICDKETGELYPEYILGKVEDGFLKETVILLNEVRWISKSRVINNINKKVADKLFDEIYNRSFAYIFKSKFNENIKLKKEIESLKNKIDTIKNV